MEESHLAGGESSLSGSVEDLLKEWNFHTTKSQLSTFIGFPNINLDSVNIAFTGLGKTGPLGKQLKEIISERRLTAKIQCDGSDSEEEESRGPRRYVDDEQKR